MSEGGEFFRQKRDRGEEDRSSRQREQHDQNLTGDSLFEILGGGEGWGGGVGGAEPYGAV